MTDYDLKVPKNLLSSLQAILDPAQYPTRTFCSRLIPPGMEPQTR